MTYQRRLPGSATMFSVVVLALSFSQPLFAQWFPDLNSDQLIDAELLHRPDVKAELELLDYQVQELQRRMSSAKSSFDKKLAEARAESPSVSPKTLDQDVRLWFEQALQEVTTARQEVMLPHQLSRLDELRWQYRAIHDPLAAYGRAMELRDDQQADMRRKERELRAEFTAKLWSFHQRSQREILEVLTPEQRMNWQNAVGEEFRFQTQRSGLNTFRRLK